mgnify:FL=1
MTEHLQTPVFCIDLDDTVFQTARKMTAAQRAGAVPAALDRQGRPRSFMTRRQRALLDWLNAHARLVPVTGRGTEELGRVRIPFRSWRVATHGAVVLTPDGDTDALWRTRILQIVAPVQQRLKELEGRCADFFQARGYDAFARINREYGMGIYLVLKHRDSSRLNELHAIVRDLFPRLDLSFCALSVNDNNISLLPRGVGKAPALRHVLERMRATEETPVIGLGDSLSDIPFLSLCDWWGMPRKSQIADAVARLPRED